MKISISIACEVKCVRNSFDSLLPRYKCERAIERVRAYIKHTHTHTSLVFTVAFNCSDFIFIYFFFVHSLPSSSFSSSFSDFDFIFLKREMNANRRIFDTFLLSFPLDKFLFNMRPISKSTQVALGSLIFGLSHFIAYYVFIAVQST